jgi:hypothetical protein
LQILQNETSVTVIDPTGALAEAAANQLPAALTQRALYFDPADMARPIGLNILENVPVDDRHRVTEQLCEYFEAMWPTGWRAQSNYILANCLRLLLDNNEKPCSVSLNFLPTPLSANSCSSDAKIPSLE